VSHRYRPPSFHLQLTESEVSFTHLFSLIIPSTRSHCESDFLTFFDAEYQVRCGW